MAKTVKLKDRNANEILPLTRATHVEMNNNNSVEDEFSYVYSYLNNKQDKDLIVTLTDSNNTITANHTYSEILTAYNAGIDIKVIYDNFVYIIQYVDGGAFYFTVTEGDNYNVKILILSSNGEWEYAEYYYINEDKMNSYVATAYDNLSSYISTTYTYTFNYIEEIEEGVAAALVDLNNRKLSFESDPIFSASVAYNITQSDITYWNSKADVSNFPSLASYATSANYDSAAQKIYLKHGTTILSEIDATDFIKDGMVDTAYVSNGNLIISFNGDAEKIPVQIPITDIFNASNYYTKTDIDSAAYLQSETDPTVPSYVKGITEADITRWNNTSGLFVINFVYNGTSIVSCDKTFAQIKAAYEAGKILQVVINNGFAIGYLTQVTSSSITFNVVDTQLYDRIVSYELSVYDDDTYAILISDINPGDFITDETDPTVPSYVKGITQTDITYWNNKIDSANFPSMSSYATAANYDSSTQKIYLKHGTTVLSEIDATDFIKDGMVDTAYVSNGNLIISFNGDAEKIPVQIPITDIFNASNYYTKTDIDSAAYVTSAQLSSASYVTSAQLSSASYVTTPVFESYVLVEQDGVSRPVNEVVLENEEITAEAYNELNNRLLALEGGGLSYTQLATVDDFELVIT